MAITLRLNTGCQCTKIIRQFLYKKCLKRHLQVIKLDICLIENVIVSSCVTFLEITFFSKTAFVSENKVRELGKVLTYVF